MYDRGKSVFITEIKFLLELLQQDHDELKRLISGLPEEYKNPRPGILKFWVILIQRFFRFFQLIYQTLDLKCIVPNLSVLKDLDHHTNR